MVVGKSAGGGGYIEVVAVREGSLKVNLSKCMCKPGPILVLPIKDAWGLK